MRSKGLAVAFALIFSVLILIGFIYSQKNKHIGENPQAFTEPSSTPNPLASPSIGASPSATASPSPAPSPNASVSPSPDPSGSPVAQNVDLTTGPDGLSHATVAMTTTEGVVKFKFYTDDAPVTVHRIVQLIQQGFYNGLTFHRVVPGFVVQGGDPTGTGMGGSGTKLKAEFNNRHHVEGTLAMARTADDVNSADSQFYICLSPQPELDHKYTVFGQVIDGMDVVRKIKVGDKMLKFQFE